MSDLLHQDIATVASDKNKRPVTLASATTVAPTTFITFITGTTDVDTVTPPVTGAHMLCFIFTDASPGDILTTGNVLVGTTTVTQNVPVLLFYDPSQAKYYPANLV